MLSVGIAWLAAFVAPGVKPIGGRLEPRVQQCPVAPAAPRRCQIVAFADEEPPVMPPGGLGDQQIVRIFQEFDTSGDGFIDLGELQAALSKAGTPVSRETAETIMKRVDANDDGQISLDEFRAVFTLAPDAVPDGLKPLTGVANYFLDSLGRVGDALGIEVAGQWRTTAYGSRYVDDVVGGGSLVRPGDLVRIHYTVTLLSTGQVVESSRNGPPLGFRVGEPTGDVQGWNDAIAGMRMGGQRRVYASPSEGPTARYDIEIVDAEEGSERSAQEGVVTMLGGRRAAFRLLFAASFLPYLLPEDSRPAFFREGAATYMALDDEGADASKPRVDAEDEYVARQLDALFPATGK